MASQRMEPIIRHLRTTFLRRDEAGLSDGQYLQCFIADHDAAAFEALVRRHGRMVLGVCRRILGDSHDADDCFQATFLVLVRKAASISPPDKVGNWLYGVAQTTAIRVKAAKAKRQRREKLVSQVPDREVMHADHRENVPTLLDEELAHLPDKYRTPIVLCDLEGRQRKEVASQLRIPEGTLSSRLTTARRLLGKRLARRGLAVSAGLLAALSRQSASACLPASLVSSTVKAALLVAAGQTTSAGIVSLKAAALMEGVLKTMLLTKLKIATAATLLLVLVLGGAGAIYRTQASEPRKAAGTHEQTAEPSNRPSAGEKTATAPQRRMRRVPAVKQEKELSEVKLGENVAEYNEIFDNVLNVVEDYFEVAYANRYEGRIETQPQSLVLQPMHLRRRAIVLITWDDSGGYLIRVHVVLESEMKTSGLEGKKAHSPPHDTAWQSRGRDSMLERVMLRRMIELDRRRQTTETRKGQAKEEKISPDARLATPATPEEVRKQQAREEKSDQDMRGGDHSRRILLKNVHLDTVDPEWRRISFVTLDNGPTTFLNVWVARDTKIKVKGGTTFANLKIGMRVRLELCVRNNRLVVTEIRQERLSTR